MEPLLRLQLLSRSFGFRIPPQLTQLSITRRTFHISRSVREQEFDPRTIERESDEIDVCIVGGGPAGLSAAIRLKQLAQKNNRDMRVLLLEKGSEMGSSLIHCNSKVLGAHTLSGAVLQPDALEELFPNWLEDPPQPVTPAKKDKMRFLTKGMAIPIPEPPQMHNKGNYIISLNNLVKWLAEKAEELGVEVYPGFAASEVHLADVCIFNVRFCTIKTEPSKE